MTLASILTATRFKMYDSVIAGGSVLLPTQCHICGQTDGPEHLLGHMGEEAPPRGPLELVDFLVNMATTAQRRNPQVPIPQPLAFSGDFELNTDMLWEEGETDNLSINEGGDGSGS